MKLFSFFAALCLLSTLACCNGAVARYLVTLGKPASIDFGPNNFVIQRNTKAHIDPQYIFASPKQDGTWTTNGKNKIGRGAHLYWNGTLAIKSVSADDIGAYQMPMEIPSPNLPKTVLFLELEKPL